MDYVILGQRIRHYRRKLGLTQEFLAEQADISPSFMGHIERGSRISSLDTLMKLCTALKVTPNDLLKDDAFVPTFALPEKIVISPRRLLGNIGLLLAEQENTD